MEASQADRNHPAVLAAAGAAVETAAVALLIGWLRLAQLLKLLWHTDFARLRSYVSENDSSPSLYMLHQVEAVFPDTPEIGRTGRVAGTRQLVIPKTPFIVPYRVNGQSLEILRIYHAAQRWPEVF